jgi:large subunit ribosomal protein L3
MAMLLGKKIGMTRLYDGAGKLVPATVMRVGPCVVTQVKTEQTDGYNAVQLGFDDVKPSRRKKPQVNHFAKASSVPKVFIREMRLSTEPEYTIGDAITVSVFSEDDIVDVTSISKGRGFAGVMKRYGFGGFPGSHGTERKHRAPGSIGSHASNAGGGGGPKKGKRMAGHMGHERVTTKNHPLLSVDPDRNILIVKGAVPGASGAYCIIRSVAKKSD